MLKHSVWTGGTVLHPVAKRGLIILAQGPNRRGEIRLTLVPAAKDIRAGPGRGAVKPLLADLPQQERDQGSRPGIQARMNEVVVCLLPCLRRAPPNPTPMFLQMTAQQSLGFGLQNTSANRVAAYSKSAGGTTPPAASV